MEKKRSFGKMHRWLTLAALFWHEGTKRKGVDLGIVSSAPFTHNVPHTHPWLAKETCKASPPNEAALPENGALQASGRGGEDHG